MSRGDSILKCKLLCKIFSSIKSWVIKHEFLAWTFASVLFAFVIHCLFSKDAPTEWLGAEWTAGEILTYTSTVALGLLALWQNKRFKKANDEAQERMEELTKYANEISLKSQLIDIESKHIENVKVALDKFYVACDMEEVTFLFSEYYDNEYLRKAAFRRKGSEADQAFLNLMDIISADRAVDVNEIRISAYLFYSAAKAVLGTLIKENEPDSITLKNQLDNSHKNKENFIKDREIYMYYKEKAYNQLVYEDLTLSEIKKIYSINNIPKTCKNDKSNK